MGSEMCIRDRSITSSQGTAGAISEQEVTLSGQLVTSSLGSLTIPNATAQLDGLSIEAQEGSLVGLGGAVAQPTGQSATASVGALDPNDMTLGLTGVSFSASVGSLTVVDMQVGLTGQSATFNIGSVNIFAYGDVDTGSNTSYSDVSTGSNDTYSDVATGSNTSYSDAA